MRSRILVGIQFSAIAAIAALGTIPVTPFSFLLCAFGVLLGLVSIIIMNFDNLRIRPEPKENIRLVTAGPYRIIRHPMYISVLLFSLSFIVDDPTVLLGALFIVLFIALLAKMRIEERMLPEIFPEYRDYAKRTNRLIPYIF